MTWLQVVSIHLLFPISSKVAVPGEEQGGFNVASYSGVVRYGLSGTNKDAGIVSMHGKMYRSLVSGSTLRSTARANVSLSRDKYALDITAHFDTSKYIE